MTTMLKQVAAVIAAILFGLSFVAALRPGAHHLVVLDWGRFAVMPDTVTNLPAEGASNHYYAARETDAALVRVCHTNGRAAEFEKFLFYRGVGGFDLPMSVKLDGNLLRLAGLTDIAQ